MIKIVNITCSKEYTIDQTILIKVRIQVPGDIISIAEALIKMEIAANAEGMIRYHILSTLGVYTGEPQRLDKIFGPKPPANE